MIAKKIKISLICTFIAAGILIGGVVYYFVFTNRGSDFIARSLLRDYVETDDVGIGRAEGSFSGTLIYHDIEFRDLKWLPKGNSIKVQKLEVSLSSFSPQGLGIKIDNGRLRFSGSEAILFYGEYRNGELDVSVYSNDVNIRDILDLFAESSILNKISGILKDLDAAVTGSLFEPEISGTFYVQKLSREGFSVTDSPGTVNLKIKDIKDNFSLDGEISLRGGAASGPKTAVINLKEGKLRFDGGTEGPSMDFKGEAIVDKIGINIALKGTFSRPDLKLTSKPAMPEDRLLLMLATNKSWQSLETAAVKRELSADIAGDFLDYFIFSGSGNRAAERFGVRDVSVKYGGTTAGIGATKDISNKTAVSYSIEQQQEKGGAAAVSQKVGTEYKITENVSVTGEKEIRQNNAAADAKDKQKTDDKVMVKFKQEF